MYLSKKDYDFLVHLHDDFFCMKVGVRLDGDNLEKEIPVHVASFMEEDDYVYFINMLRRFKDERTRTNEKTRIIISKRRKDDKNYARPKR